MADARNRPKAKQGRPCKLTETDKEVAVALFSVGLSRAAVARYLRVAPQTVSNTAARDMAFGDRLEQARASLETRHLAKLGLFSQRSWRASAWALEKLAPERFADPESPAAIRREQQRRARSLAALIRQVNRLIDRQRIESAQSDRLKSEMVEAIEAAFRGLIEGEQSGSRSESRAA